MIRLVHNTYNHLYLNSRKCNYLLLPNQIIEKFNFRMVSSLTTVDKTIKSNSNPSAEVIEVVDSIRLSKFISNTGVCSRREAENWIRSGRVTVNGSKFTSVTALVPIRRIKIDSNKSNENQIEGTNYDISTSISTINPKKLIQSIDITKKPIVMVDGVNLNHINVSNEPKLWLAYKFKGELSCPNVDSKAIKNHKDEKIVSLMQDTRPILSERICKYLPKDELHSIRVAARLDYNTEGLVILANSHALTDCLNNKAKDLLLERTYRIRVHGLITESKLLSLREGVYINGKKQKTMTVKIEKKLNTNTWLNVSTSEISNRLIIQTLKTIHLSVGRMICTSIGPYKLTDLENIKSGVKEVKLNTFMMSHYLKYQSKSLVGLIDVPSVPLTKELLVDRWSGKLPQSNKMKSIGANKSSKLIVVPKKTKLLSDNKSKE